jgi:hypothetical protein
MNENDQIIALLTRVEENQRKALETQEKHLALAQAQLDRSNRTIQESIELQRSSAARQTPGNKNYLAACRSSSRTSWIPSVQVPYLVACIFGEIPVTPNHSFQPTPVSSIRSSTVAAELRR